MQVTKSDVSYLIGVKKAPIYSVERKEASPKRKLNLKKIT